MVHSFLITLALGYIIALLNFCASGTEFFKSNITSEEADGLLKFSTIFHRNTKTITTIYIILLIILWIIDYAKG